MAWDLATITGNLNTTFAPVIADQLNQHAVTLGIMPKTIGEGKAIYWDAKLVRGTSAASYASGADITGNDNDTEKPATLTWKYNKAEFKVTGDALAAAATAGPAAYANLFGKAIKDATRNLGISLGSQVFGDGTGNSNLDLDGLGAILADSGTYANIGRATYSTWRSNVLANSGSLRSFSVSLLRQAEKAIYTASGMMPNLIVMGPDLYEAYEGLFDSIKRVNNPEVYNRADAGIAQLFFKGIPVVRDVYAAANTVYMLNTDCLEFRQLKPVVVADGIQLVQAQDTITTADGNIGLQVAIEMLGKSGDNYKGFVKVYGNMVCERPNCCAIIKDVE